MPTEPIQSMMRKKVLELKTDMPGFYTETYNIVSTLIRLIPADSELIDLIQEKIGFLYTRPSTKYNMSLAHFEDLYTKYKGDSTFKVKKSTLDIYEIKRVLDRVRRDLLFYLAVVESPAKSYDIKVGEILPKEIDTDAAPPSAPSGQQQGSEVRQKEAKEGKAN